VQRIKTRAQFQAVMAGSTVSKTTHFALHRTRPDAPIAPATGPGSERSKALFAVGEPSIGVMLPKRWAKRAVTRNAIKRQIYAVSQDFEAQLPQAPHVVRLRSAFDRRQFISAESAALKQAVRVELQQLFSGARAKAAA
jgi:ribonuclease P protein component